MKPSPILRAFLLAAAAVLAGHAQAAVVSTIDPAGAGEVTLGTTTTGNFISKTDMQALITAKNDLTLAGVLNAEGTFTAGDFSADPDYASLKLGITNGAATKRYGRSDGTATTEGRTSGSRWGYVSGSETWTITPPIGGLVTHFGLTLRDYTSTGGNTTLTATFSGGGTETFTTSTLGYYFVGFAAPTGQSIVSLALSENYDFAIGGADFGSYDDVSFVAIPEPSAALLGGLGLLALLRRRR